MIQIIPAILATKEEDFKRDIFRYKNAESFKNGWVHIDFMDNIFVPNESIGPSVVANYSISLHKEAHLMVANPKDWIDGLIKSGIERVIIHVESENIKEAINYAKQRGLEVGLALKNETPLEELEQFISEIDVVILMGVVPGLQGQPFIPGVIDKMKELKFKNWFVKAGIDGAVKNSNIKDIISAGVDFVIVGSYLLQGDPDENLEILWETINA